VSAADGGGVTRQGPQNPRPGREARQWSGVDERPARAGGPNAHPGGSYYGNSIINPPTWAESDIAGYLFAGGLAGGSSILAAGADLTGRPVLARRARICATGAISVSLVALVHDLGRPERFLHMLRVFKPSSPMSVGVWILFFYGPLAAGSAASDVLGLAPRSGRAAGVGAGLLGAGVSSYTAALIADTAVPAWHEAHRELPFLFVGSAAAASSGFGLVAAPRSENEPARRIAVLGAIAELVASELMHRRLGMVAEALQTGTAGRRLRIAKALTATGALMAATLAGRSRVAAVGAGAALLAGSALTRFGIFAGGMQSARDPKYTVEPQRARVRDRAAATATS
jgi:formate-dependent nitrite reductase membrane component NrfD